MYNQQRLPKTFQVLSRPMTKQYLPEAPQPTPAHEAESTLKRTARSLAGIKRHLVCNTNPDVLNIISII